MQPRTSTLRLRRRSGKRHGRHRGDLLRPPQPPQPRTQPPPRSCSSLAAVLLPLRPRSCSSSPSWVTWGYVLRCHVYVVCAAAIMISAIAFYCLSSRGNRPLDGVLALARRERAPRWSPGPVRAWAVRVQGACAGTRPGTSVGCACAGTLVGLDSTRSEGWAGLAVQWQPSLAGSVCF